MRQSLVLRICFVFTIVLFDKIIAAILYISIVHK